MLDPVHPWLVAAWPGMGGVAQIGASYLVQKLGAEPLAEIDGRDFFGVQSIRIKDGLVQPSEVPRTVLYGWKGPKTGHDLLILLGERQPTADAQRYCEALLDAAAKFRVERVFTFAAMATPIHPQGEPRVFAVATQPSLLEELRRLELAVLGEGEISGLNGVFVAAAEQRQIAAACLLGEFPFFASHVPNPKSSAAVLRAFAKLAGFQVDMAELLEDAAKIERGLTQHLEKLQEAARSAAETGQESDEAMPGEGGEDWRSAQEPAVDPKLAARIDKLFARAKKDRAAAIELKAELDRQQLFKQYEDRFLDLFKHAE